MRVLWAANELGLDSTHVPYEWNAPVLKSPDFHAINPAGAIPPSTTMAFSSAKASRSSSILPRSIGCGRYC